MNHTLRSLSSEKGDSKIVRKVDGFRVKLSAIRVIPGFNERVERDELREHIAGIAGAIAAGDRPQEITVWINPADGVPEVVDGHCTYRAYQIYASEAKDFDGWVEVKEFRGTEAQKKAFIAKSNRQLPLTGLERGRVYMSLRDEFGYTRQMIAEEIGCSLAHVDQMLKIAGAPEPVTQAIERGEISTTEAVKLVRDHGDNSVAELESRKELAAASGKEKITPKVAPPKKPAAPSRPRVDFVVSCAVVLANHIERDAELLEKIESIVANPAGLGERVEVHADLLLDLVEAVREMRQAGKPLDADKQEELVL